MVGTEVGEGCDGDSDVDSLVDEGWSVNGTNDCLLGCNEREDG